MSLAIANRYARALADVVLAPGSGLDPATALAQIREFADLLAQSSELRNALLTPAVAAARKQAVVARLGEQIGFHSIVRNFLMVVINHRRVAQFASMAQAFETVLDERQGRVRALVSSSSELGQAERDSLAAELRALTGKEVRCEFSADPSLVGGVSVRIGSTIYDGSVRGQLNALRGRLA
jgi:F-type H+-transporting ATPase subunit delta